MEVKDYFSDSEMALMNRFVKTYGHPDAMPMERYLTHWLDGKSQYLLPMFKGNLIIKEHVEYREPEEKIYNRVNDALNGLEWIKCRDWLSLIVNKVLFKGTSFEEVQGSYLSHRNTDRTLYIEFKKQYDMSTNINYLLRDMVSFTHNRVRQEILYDEDGLTLKEMIIRPDEHSYLRKPFVLRLGQKPFRFINSIIQNLWPIAHELDPQAFSEIERNKIVARLEQFRLAHSVALNTKMLEGELCLSIHPLDFLTASDNANKWNSCMAWTRPAYPGEFRNGVVELMHSYMTVIAYLNNTDKPFYPFERMGDTETTWNNKLWREFFVVNESYIAAIKGYPYHCDTLEKIVLHKLARLAEEYGWPKYNDNVYETFSDSLELSNGVGFNMETELMYNDTIDNGARFIESTKLPEFQPDGLYSGTMYCIVCNAPIYNEHDGDRECNEEEIDDVTTNPYCLSCAPKECCTECGKKLIPYPGKYDTIRGKKVCSNCYSECQICGGHMLYSDNIDIDVIDKNTHHVFGCRICPDCFQKYNSYIMRVDISNNEVSGAQWWMTDFWTIKPNAPDELYKAINQYRDTKLLRENVLDLSSYATKILT